MTTKKQASKRARKSRARFWMMTHNPGRSADWGLPDFVRLALRSGERAEWSAGRESTDEGWADHGWIVEHRGGHVAVWWWSDGADCDGRLSSEHHATCPLADLTAVDPGYGWPRLPKWRDGRRRQRDHTAEAAGY